MGRASKARRLIKSGEVLKRSGITRQALYVYSTLGLLDEAKTTPGGQKLYDESVVRRIELIHDLQESGYTLRDMAAIFRFEKDEPSDEADQA